MNEFLSESKKEEFELKVTRLEEIYTFLFLIVCIMIFASYLASTMKSIRKGSSGMNKKCNHVRPCKSEKNRSFTNK